MTDVQELKIGADRALGVTAPDPVWATVLNRGPASVYFATAPTVSALVNDGTLAAGASLTFRASKWFIGAGRSRINVTVPDRLSWLEDQVEVFDIDPVTGLPSPLVSDSLINVPSTDDQVPRWDQANGRFAWKDPAEFDPRDFGAATTEVRVQAAITAAAAAGSGTVVLTTPHTVATTITIPSNVSVRARPGGTLTAAAGLVGPVISNADTSLGNNNILLDGLIVDANKAARPGDVTPAVRLVVALSAGGTGYLNNITVKNCEIKNSPYIGMQLARVRNFKITDNYVHDCERDGIQHVYDCDKGDVAGNLVVDCDDDAIAFNAESVPLKNVTGDMTSASNVVSNISGSTSLVQVGDSCKVAGAGAAGVELISIITAKTATTLTLTDNASTTVTGAAVSVGTVGHAMTRITCVHNIVIGGTGGGGIACFGLQDSLIVDNISYQSFFYGIAVANWNTTPAKGLTISNNLIVQAGINNVGEGNGILLRASRSTSSDGGYAGLDRIKLIGNEIYDSRVNGIRGSGDTPTSTTITRLDVHSNTVMNSGVSGSTATGVLLDVITDLSLIDNLAADDQGTKTQSVGFGLSNITGILRVLGNDGNGNLTAGMAGRFSITSVSGVTKIAIADNPGYEPWQSAANVAGTWSSLTVGASTVYYKDVAITYGVPFPALPVVTCNSAHTGVGASAVSQTVSGFTLRQWAYGDPGNGTHSAHWVARPIT